jgi:hypothetical protein
MSGARVRTQRARWDIGRATRHARREVVFGPMRGQRTFVGWGVERHRQQAAQRGQRTSWQPSLVATQLTTVAGCEFGGNPQWQLNFINPAMVMVAGEKSAKGPRNPEETGNSS